MKNVNISQDLTMAINNHNGNDSKVFVTTHSLYNEGLQFASVQSGFWIACDDYQLLESEIFDMFCELESASGVEIMFTDYEGFPKSLYSESAIDFDLIAAFNDLSDSDKELLSDWLDHGSYDFEDSLKHVVDGDIYLFEGTKEDYAYELFNDCYEIPSHLSNYIDYEAVARDMSMENEFIELSHDQLLIVRGL